MELAIMAILAVVGSIITAVSSNSANERSIQAQQQMQRQGQLYNTEREDVAYERSLPTTQMQNYIDAGFNPNLAANSILGGNDNQYNALGAPSAPSVNSAADALGSILGGGTKNLTSLFKESAEIQNLNANTNKQEIEAGIMPRDYQLRVMSTNAQIRLWNDTANKYCAEAKLSEAQTDLVKQQNLYYGRLTEAQIESYKAQCTEAYSNAMKSLEQINTEKAKQRNLDSDTMVNMAQEQNIRANTEVQYQEAHNLELRNQREEIALNFEIALGDIPLTADAQKYVQKMAKDGDIDGINTFYNTIFSTALNQQLGIGQGDYWTTPDWSLGLPFGIANMRGSMPLTGQHKRGNYNLPYWHPQFTLPGN